MQKFKTKFIYTFTHAMSLQNLEIFFFFIKQTFPTVTVAL